jgi:large subunit ribosomal protein L10e
MVALRKANSYSKRIVVPFTRVSKRRQKSYIKVVPPQKIVKFTMGDAKGFDAGKYPIILRVLSKQDVQVRHNSLEACRQYVNKQLEKGSAGQYIFKIVPFPHHIQREHRMLTGAGADRMSSGMQLSFGKSMGKAAILKKDDELFFFAVNSEKNAALVRKLVKQVKSKLPCTIRIVDEKNV